MHSYSKYFQVWVVSKLLLLLEHGAERGVVEGSIKWKNAKVVFQPHISVCAAAGSSISLHSFSCVHGVPAKREHSHPKLEPLEKHSPASVLGLWKALPARGQRDQ